MLAQLVEEPYATILPYSMVGQRRLRNLAELMHDLNEQNVPGDIVECGTCNGGSGALLALAAREGPMPRHTWLLDSFQGLPAADARDGHDAATWTGLCRGSEDSVRTVMGKLGLSEECASIVPGWFSDTLPTLAVEQIALLHIDADWYQSVYDVLNALYDRVTPGGYVVLDDFGHWQGCARAWSDFSRERELDLKVTDVDGTGAYLRIPKPGSP